MKIIFFITILFISTTLLCQSTFKIKKDIKDTNVSYVFKGAKRLDYPLAARENNIQGKVVMVFDIDSTCSIINRRVIKGIGFGCDEEALRALNEVEFNLKNDYNSSCIPIKNIETYCNFKMK